MILKSTFKSGFKAGLYAGTTLGYFLGAKLGLKTGRRRFEQLRSLSQTALRSDRVQQLSAQTRALTDRATTRIEGKANQGADKVTAAVRGSDASDVGHHNGSA